MSQAAIAEQVGIGHSTVSNWLAAGTFAERKPREQACRLDRYLPYLFERWEEGCHKIASLFRELVGQGYKGSYASVYGPLVRLLPQGRKHASGPQVLSPAPLPARQATFLFRRRSEALNAEEQETLRQSHAEVERADDLVPQFVQMLRSRTGEHLNEWLARVVDSKIP